MPSRRILPGFFVALSCLCFFIPGNVYGQFIRHLNAHQLLRTSKAFQVVRDSKGFLWFCSDRGLVKYNGHTTEHFNRQRGLADDVVFNVFEDKQGRIWPFCYNGKYCFIDGDSVHNESNDTMLAALPHGVGFTTYMIQVRDSTLLFGLSSRSVLRLKRGQGSWVETHKSGDNTLEVFQDRFVFKNGIGTSMLTGDGKHRLTCDLRGIKMFLGDSLIWHIEEEALSYGSVTDMFLSDKGELMICTLNGLEIINLRTNERKKLLHGVRVSSCCADVVGNFWITTLEQGIYVLNQELQQIRRLNGFDGLVWSMLDDNRFVFTKDNKLYELNTEAGGIVARSAVSGVANYYNPVLLTDEFSVFYDPWQKYPHLITKGNGVEKNSKINIRTATDLAFFKKMHMNPGKDIFAYGDYVVYHYQFEQGRLKFIDTTGFVQKISASCQDPKTRAVYFVSGDTLYHYDFSSSTAKALIGSADLRGTTALLSWDSCLLFATGKNAFYSFFPISETGRISTQEYVFPVLNIQPFGKNGLLLFSDENDYLLRTGAPARVPEKIQYPFSSAEYEDLALLGANCLVKIEGQYYYFDTSLLNRRKLQANVYLKRLTINGKDYSEQNIDIRNTSRLDIQISLGMLGFGNNVRKIRYRLSGPTGGQWSSTSATELAFVLQKAGTYEIQILPDDASASKALVLRITVHTPFFRSAGFITFCVLLALAAIAGIVHFIIRYRRRHLLRELNYLKLEHRAINALLNPHFIFNSINNIQGLIHQSDRNDAAEYLAVLSRLIRQNLENLQYNLIPLENEIALIRRYIRLQNLRFGGMLQLDVEASDSELETVHIPPLLLHTFVENAIVHGFRQTNKPFRIRIVVGPVVDNYLRITITDDGVGLEAAKARPAAHQHNSMGVSFNRKRLQRLSGFYKLEQSIILTDLSGRGGQGTEVEIMVYARLRELLEQRNLTVH